MGTIPARQLRVGLAVNTDAVTKLVSAAVSDLSVHSNARQERLRRSSRKPIEVAVQLGRRYGHGLKNVQYIPAVAVIGRLRLSELTGDASHRAGIDELIAPYRDGSRPAISDKPSGSDFAGHLLFGEQALKTNDAALIKLAKTAADFAFDKNGQPREAMPSHVEMSDAVFMACPLLTQVGRLTGEAKYHDMSLRHLAFMRKLCVRPDGLYRNSPLNDAAWGRGNGFPALGLAWALTDLPPEHPGRADMLAAFQQHLLALRQHQDPTGMWHRSCRKLPRADGDLHDHVCDAARCAIRLAGACDL
jgi:rhamnogalacturonyl hydrolase YesR